MGNYGVRGHIGLGKETTWGVAVAATDYLEALSEGVTETLDRYPTKAIIGALYEPDDMPGLYRVGGPIVAAAHPVSVGHFLNAAFGASSISVVLSGALWTTAFTPASGDAASANPLPAYTAEIFRDVTSSQRYAGLQCTGLTFEVSPNAPLRVTANWLGKAATNIAKTTPSFPGSPTQPFAFDTASLTLGAGATALLEALTITVDNRLTGVPVLNAATEIAKVRREGAPTVRVSGTMAFESITEYLNFRNQTEQRLMASFVRASSFALVLDCPRVVYTTHPLGLDGEGRPMVRVEGIARYHTTSLYAIEARLTTTKSNFS